MLKEQLNIARPLSCRATSTRLARVGLLICIFSDSLPSRMRVACAELADSSMPAGNFNAGSDVSWLYLQWGWIARGIRQLVARRVQMARR